MKESLLALIGMAIVLFASTNVDDVFVIVGFLAEKRILTRDIVLGQYVGLQLCSAEVSRPPYFFRDPSRLHWPAGSDSCFDRRKEALRVVPAA